RVAETVEAIRAWLQAENGDKIRYTGKFHAIHADVRAPVLGRLEIPLLLGAFNKRMAATAGRIADGVIVHGLFTGAWWKDVVRPPVRKGAADGGRHVVEQGWIITAIDDAAPERAIFDARRMIAYYLTVRTYDPFVSHHGWETAAAQIREAFRVNDTHAM